MKRLVPNIAIAGLMLAALLGGCSKSTPEDQPVAVNDSTSDATPITAESPAERAAPGSLLAPTVATAEPTEAAPQPEDIEPREPPAAPDAQMLDDADATGMTARVSRDAPTANEAAPE